MSPSGVTPLARPLQWCTWPIILKFLAFFERLVGSRAAAEDLLQTAFARTLERARQAAEDTDRLDPELHDVVCACVRELVPNVKPEYAEILRKVDLEEREIGDVARELGLSSTNMRVRLHRARRALKQQLEVNCGTCATHGCLACACGGPRPTLTLRPARGT